MFPSPNRDNKLFVFNPSPSLERSEINKSAQLPYFKRFPHNKYLSQERARLQKYQTKYVSPSNVVISPPKNNPHRRASFFKNQKVSSQQKIQSRKISFFQTNQNLQKKESTRKKLFRRHPQKQQHLTKHRTEPSKEKNKSVIMISKSKNKSPILGINRMDGSEATRKIKNLLQYEKQQLVNYPQVYYHGQNCEKKLSSLEEYTKKEGGYNWLKGDHVHYRFQFLELLGQGSFGEVFKCQDHKLNCLVALKMVKNNEKYTQQAKTQIKILNHIKAKDTTNTKNCVHIKDFFMFRSRICMTFDLMSLNLYELIKSNGYYGLPLDLIRRMTLQILNSLYFLHKNSIIHADLKPENILLKEVNKSGLRVIDFGSSCYENQTVYTYIQSRYYRAPEVILGLPYNRKIDIWSFACIIAELHLGYPIFAGDDEHEQICLLVQVLGLPSQSLSNNAKRWSIFFDKNNSLKNNRKKLVPKSKTLNQALENLNDEEFTSFLLSCLEWSPQKRAQALQLLKHEWVLKGLPEQIRNQHLKFVQEQEQKMRNEKEKKKWSREKKFVL